MGNILFLNNSGTCWGGVENWTFKTARALDRKGHNIFIVGRSDSPLCNRSLEEGFEVKAISRITSATFINPLRIYKLVKYLRSESIDAIFFCSSSTFKYGAFSAKLAGVKNIIYRRGSAIPIKNKFYNRYLMNNCLTKFIANSKATKNETLKYLNLSSNKVELIYNGVDLNRFKDVEKNTNLYQEFDISNDKLLIANIGRLDEQKGQQYLIKAVDCLRKKFNNFMIFLVGDGVMEEELKNMVRKLDLEEYIIFTGFREDIPSILNQIDFVIHTALWEGCPWTIIEALASGTPVVAADSSSLPELIIDGKNGYLARNKDINDVAEKMLKMCKNPDRERLGVNARREAKKRFSFERVVNKLEECMNL